MKAMHLTEIEIQDYVIDAKSNHGFSHHIESCESCKNKVVQYQMLFKEIKNSPAPIFDFNLNEAVLKQLPVNEPIQVKRVFTNYLPVLVSIILLLLPLYFYRNNLLSVVKQTPAGILYMGIIIALIVTVYQSVGLSKKHHKQMNALNIMDGLQQ